jgi:hypothetical protein
VTLNYCSLNAGDIPTRPAPQTPDEVYRECQYYYRKSFLPGQIPSTTVTAGRMFGYQPVSSGSTFVLPYRFDYPMINAPRVSLLNPNTNTSQIRDEITNSDYSSSGTSNVTTNGFLCTGTPPGGSSLGDLISVQWVADARLGTF